MAFNFPASPSIGQTYTPVAGISYVWTGTYWDRLAAPFPTMPAGVMAPFAGSAAPVGALLCDGKPYSRIGYAVLFAVIGTTYGAGDGSATFNVPDLRGRIPVGRDDMGGSAANRVTVAISGINGATLGAVGGDQRVQTHTHDGSGTTSFISADHTHAGSGTTSGESVDHAHYISGYTSVNGNHAHQYDRMAALDPKWIQGGASNGRYNEAATTVAAGDHQHTVNFWSGGINVGHTHTYSFNTGGVSANHTHTYNFTSTTFGAGASQNVQPAIIANYIIFTGA